MDSKSFKGLTLIALMLAGYSAHAQLIQETSVQVTQPVELIVPLYKSRVLSSTMPVERVSVGNPDIADILILRSRELYVLGKDLGTTNVLLWDNDDRLVGSVSVEVTHDLEGLKQKLYELMPNENIMIYAAQRSIVLAGSVSSLVNMNAAMQIARGYLVEAGTAVEAAEFEASGDNEGEVVNLMQVSGAQQVMLEVKVAEISRTELKRMDMQFNWFDTSSSRWTLTGVTEGGAVFPDTGPAASPLSIQDRGFTASLLTGHTILDMALDAAKEKGLAKILAEPTLTTLSGQEAQFLSGGEFPIPVPQQNGSVTIEFKEFGVGLNFVPVVLGSGHINLKLNISVSELTDATNVAVSSDNTTSTFLVPSLSRRSASATVELNDGQTMGIAGLINEDLREVVNKFPGLGSIPVIGNLFRSQEFIKGETELVILVTPRLARPLPRDQIRLPTDSFVEPSDKDFYLMGRLEAKPAESDGEEGAETAMQDGEGGVESYFGHEVE